jgi:hypothetical protein
MSGSDVRVGSRNVSPSPLSAFAKDANEALLTPPISAMTPPTRPNVGSSATKRTKAVLPSEMKDMQQKVQELVAKVDGATTPQGISNALRELEELQQKLSNIEFTPDSPSPLSSPTPKRRECFHPDHLPIGFDAFFVVVYHRIFASNAAARATCSR